jgi:hypothetical protein
VRGHRSKAQSNSGLAAVIRDTTHQWLLEQRVVRPGRTTLRDLVATAHEAGLQQTYDALTL